MKESTERRLSLAAILTIIVAVPVLVLIFGARAFAQPAPPPGCGDIKPVPLVYTRQPRATERLTPEIEDASNWQHVTDVARVYTQTEADVVLDTGGNIEVIHNCTTSPDICVAQEARVSPDGKRIAYAVARGSRLMPIMWSGINTKLTEFTAYTSELWLYNVSTKQKRRISAGHMDRSPDWCGDDCLVFTSDRHNFYPPSAHHGNDYQFKSMQVWQARVTEGEITDVTPLGPHELFAMGTTVLSNGDICWSSWQGNWPRKPGTPQNSWSIWCSDSNGANARAVLGMHGGPTMENYEYIKDWVDPSRRGEGTITLKALRGLGEIYPSYLAVVDYYRGNKVGAMGVVFGWLYDRLAEGTWYLKNILGADVYKTVPAATVAGSGRFIPSTLENLTPWGLSQDSNSPIFSKEGKAAGTAGYPAPWPGDGEAWLYTGSQGSYCYEAAPMAMLNRAAMGGGPLCKKAIYLALKRQVRNPFDPKQTQLIACASEEWQCWDARAVVPYWQLYGQPAPERKPPLEPGRCFLQVVNMRDAELVAPLGFSEQDRITWQGNAAPDYATRVDALKITATAQWGKIPPGVGRPIVPVSENVIRPEEDGSLRTEVICDAPFLMTGVDKAGNPVAIDNVTHSLREGETRTCWGCHSDSEEAAAKRPYPTAEEAFSKTIAGSK